MAKDPAFLFYSSDFLVGTYEMTYTQRGQYITLLCLQHQKGHLSEALMRSVMGGEFDKGVVCKFLVDSDGCYYNERLDSEASKRKEYSASRTKNRMSKETTTYDKDMSDICGTHLPHMENVNIDVNIDVTDTVNKSNTSVTIPPKLADVKAYCLERGNHVDAQQFIDYYETRGWMAGKAKMKNWHSAIHTWEKNNFSNDSAKGGEPAPNWKVRPND